MDRITVNEFLEEVRSHVPILRDGHELGLIIDDSPEDSGRLKRLLGAIEARAASISCDLDVVSDPEKLKALIDGVNGGDTVVLLHAKEALLPRHYAALQSLVNYHALERWSGDGTQRSIVPFHEASRFGLVTPREALEKSWSEFPPLRGIIGAALSCDVDREEAV